MKNEQDLVQFSKRLVAMREATGLSQQQLADNADIDKKTLQRIETCKMNPSFDVLVSISKGLGMELKDMFDY